MVLYCELAITYGMHDWLMLVSIFGSILTSAVCPTLHVHVMRMAVLYYIVRAGSACVIS